MVTKKEVQYIAKLARMGLTEKEIEKMQKELSKILGYVEKLKEVDVSKIEPTSHVVKNENVMKEDEINEKYKMNGDDFFQKLSSTFVPTSRDSVNEKLLRLVPDKKDDYLKVKSIFNK